MLSYHILLTGRDKYIKINGSHESRPPCLRSCWHKHRVCATLVIHRPVRKIGDTTAKILKNNFFILIIQIRILTIKKYLM